jgi:4-amino-4-deoxy-L-arabinose transferase-like glycosyltransferase
VISLVATISLLPRLTKSMWRDEGATLYSAHLSWHALWQQSRVVDLVLLPFYSVLHLWIGVSGNIAWVRALSLLAFGLTVLVVGLVGAQLGGSWCGAISSILTATNPLMIQAALDARPYALSVLAATLAVASLFKWLKRDSVVWMWWFCIFLVLTVLLQMFSVMAPLAALALAILVRRPMFKARWKEVILPLGIGLVSTLSFAALVERQRGQIAWIPPLGFRRLLTDLAGPASGRPVFYALIVLAVGVALLAWCLPRLNASQFRDAQTQFDEIGIALAWAIAPTLALIVLSLAQPVYVDRYITASAPGMALAIGLITSFNFRANTVEKLNRPVEWISAGVAGLAVLALIANSVVTSGAVSEDFQGAASYLANHVGAAGEAALPDHSLTAGISYYFHEDGQSVRTWPQRSNQSQIEGIDLRFDQRTLSHAPSSVWLVDDGSAHGTTPFIRALDRDGFKRVSVARFPGLHVVEVSHFIRPTS